MKCGKCHDTSTVILRKKDHYCDNCFLSTTNHKFRACIGKNKILSRNEKVLLCISGGPASTVLLDLVHNGISLDVHKKLRIIPYVLHVIDTTDCDIDNLVKSQCEKSNFDAYFIHISDYLAKNANLPNANHLPEDNPLKEEFQIILKSLPSTAYNDFVNKVKKHLFIKYAQIMECNYVFTAETTSTLAINLLSNLAIGRGSQVENDIGFIDSRGENVKILRPMKDISKEELDYYIKIKGLSPATLNDVKSNSLQTVISSFVIDLQENFQSTISAVCRTADKIGIADIDNDDSIKCAICKSSVKTTDSLSALDATIFSRSMSHGYKGSEVQDPTLFPYINKHLCYGCSRNYSEMKSNSPHLQNIIEQK